MLFIFVGGWLFVRPGGVQGPSVSPSGPGPSVPQCDKYISIFEHLNILVTNIYLDILSCQFFSYKYIWTFVCIKFVCTNTFVCVKTR